MPNNARQYDEPGDFYEMAKQSTKFILPPIILSITAVCLKLIIQGGLGKISLLAVILALILTAISMPVHELLHAILFPWGSTVYFYYSVKYLAAFVIDLEPISKLRFIVISLFPNLLLGLLPLLIFAFFGIRSGDLNISLFIFGTINLMFGCGDYLNVYNTIKQVPAGNLVQCSGFHTYYYPKSSVRK